MRPYASIFSLNRQELGFPPLPTNGIVRILTVDRAGWKLEYPPPKYDVSLQFYSGSSFYPYTSRFVALKATNAGFIQISEQMTFNGPKRYQADDTMVNEYISILNETEQVGVTGTDIRGTRITYGGGQALAENVRPSNIGPVLRKWGYDYMVDKAEPDGAANRSQPVRSATNRTSATAGSGR